MRPGARQCGYLSGDLLLKVCLFVLLLITVIFVLDLLPDNEEALQTAAELEALSHDCEGPGSIPFALRKFLFCPTLKPNDE